MNKELAKRLECIKRTLAEMQEVVNSYNEPTDLVQTITTNDWELLTRGIIDCETALDLNDSEPIENDWYGLFSNDYGYIRTDYGYIRTELIMDISTELTPIIFKETNILDDMGITAYRNWIIEMVDKFLYDEEGEFIKWCKLPIDKKDDYFSDKYNMDLDVWLLNEMKNIIYYSIVLEDYVDVDIESPNIDKWREDNKKQRLKEENYSKIETMIEWLKEMEVDGETMEYIIREVGMDEQMLNQLKVLYGEK